jgi:two-component system phosphate regulon sensor histidine kinase PhoR
VRAPRPISTLTPFAVAAAAALAAVAAGARPAAALAAFAAAAAAALVARRAADSEVVRDGEVARRLDASERRLAESEAARARLEAVITGMGEGVLVVGADRRVLFANPRLRELFAAPAALEGRSLLEAVRHAEIVDAIGDALGAGEACVREVSIGPAPERHLRFSAAPFPSRDERAGAVAVFRDVTELRRIESVRRDFVANASHELKTPLAAIRGFAERLADAELPDAGAKQAVEVILGNARRLGVLVDDLLELSRIESGSAPLRPEPIAVGELAQRLVRELDPRLRAGEITASVELTGAPRARADRNALEQVLTNLLDNAIKYTPAGGEITVRVAEATAGRVRVEVVDSGIGIPRKDLPRIFERFYRVDPGRSRALGGTGLGLAIVKHWVQAMGGELGVESQLGHGSSFWVELPGDAPAPPGSSAP